MFFIPAQAGTFLLTGPLNQARGYQTAVMLTNGWVLTAGGGSGGKITAELYNPATGTWTNTGSMNYPRGYFTATLLTNGQVLVSGGYGSGASTNSEIYDPAVGTWGNVSQMDFPHAAHTATLLPNGKVLVAGGYASKSAELYDPAIGTWTATGPMKNAHQYHTATLLANGKVLVAGGAGGTTGSIVTNSAEIYDPTTGTWSITGSMASPREFHTATLLTNGQVLVTGGLNSSGFYGSILASAELYDPNFGTWTNVTPMNLAREWHTATLLPNGQVLAAGGSSSQALEAELFDLNSKAWSNAGTMNVWRDAATANLLTNGMVLFAGGNSLLDFNGMTNSELYDSANLFALANVSDDSNTGLQFTFTNTPGIGFTVLGTSNLFTPAAGWSVLGKAAEISPGQYQYLDTQATNASQRFYRVRTP